jgi:putative transposase
VGVSADIGDPAVARRARRHHRAPLRGTRRHLRLSADPRPAGARGPALRRGHGPLDHAGAGLVACQPRARRHCTTRRAAEVADIPDLVDRDFTGESPGAKLVGDITYVRTGEGWLYVALVIDCFSRAIIGWAMADHYKTALITEAIRMAARRLDLPDQAIFHSDRGSNYTSDEYAQVLAGLGLRRSVGRTGICYDNALAESTNGALKVEFVNRREFSTRDIAAREIARWIELFYNQRRLHSALGYNTPNEVLADHNNRPRAA